jgi:hypothetical protein
MPHTTEPYTPCELVADSFPICSGVRGASVLALRAPDIGSLRARWCCRRRRCRALEQPFEYFRFDHVR